MRFFSFSARTALAALLCLAAASADSYAQQRAALISAEQSQQVPFRYSGRLLVEHGGNRFFGTATSIRRYTGLTAAHLLFEGKTGFSTNVVYFPAFYLQPVGTPSEYRAASFAVISGYQNEATINGDSDAAFSRDFGYILFTNPARNNEWADFQINPTILTQNGPKLVLGYAAETFTGNILAFVNTSAPYSELLSGLFESSDYYTQEGMSGGPCYALIDGKWIVVAETVAGTSPPARAFSDVRVITADERTFLIEPEYREGFVRSGLITGPATVPAGGTAAYKAGVVFQDGAREAKGQLPFRYSELKLVIAGKNKQQASVQKVKTGKFQVNFGNLPKGTQVELRLMRDTVKNKDQAQLTSYMVTVQ
jgi:V8-like Glu-specific endopeptidase